MPRYLIRDRDGIYGAAVTRRLRAMGIRDKPIAPGSPWQNGYVERLIGTIRRECLDHIIVFGEAHLRRIVGKYIYHKLQIHRSLTRSRSIGRLSASVPSHHSLSLAVFIINIVEFDFRYTQVPVFPHIWQASRKNSRSLSNFHLIYKLEARSSIFVRSRVRLASSRAFGTTSCLESIVNHAAYRHRWLLLGSRSHDCRRHLLQEAGGKRRLVRLAVRTTKRESPMAVDAKSARTLGPRKKAGSTSGRIDIEQLTLRVRIFENGRHHQIGIVIIGHQGRGGVSPCSLDVRDHVCGAIRHLERAECAGARRHVSYPRIGLQEPRALRELLAKVPPSLHVQWNRVQEYPSSNFFFGAAYLISILLWRSFSVLSSSKASSLGRIC